MVAVRLRHHCRAEARRKPDTSFAHRAALSKGGARKQQIHLSPHLSEGNSAAFQTLVMNKLAFILTVAAGLMVAGHFSCLSAQTTNGLPLKVRVGTFNVGHFNQGALGGYQGSDPQEAAQRWRAWIAQQSLDIFCVNEWDYYFDKAGTMDATALLLNPSYTNVIFGKKNTWIYNGIATNFKLSNIRQVVLTHTDYYAVLADWQVGNTVITLMSVHVPWQDCCHDTSIDALITELKKHSYVICCGDLNAPDRDVLKIKAAGFNVANGGDEGWFCTSASRCSTTTTNVHIDNIITSVNMKISNVAAPYTGLNDQDHLPVMADVEITEARALRWQGAGTNWDVGVSLNWLDGGASSAFTNGAYVRFDDTALTFSPNIATNVQPRLMTVAGTNDYQFSGPGRLDGTTGLRKEGTGVLSIANSNTFSGPVVVDNGILRYGIAGALGASATNSIYVTNNGSLDLNNMDAGSRTISIAGSGYEGRGAIINTPTDTGVRNLVGSLEFLGDATLGSSGRWNTKTGGTVLGRGHKLAKVGSGAVWLYRCGETGLGDIEVKEGSFGAYPPLGLGDPSKSLTLQPKTALSFWRNAADLSQYALDKKLVMNGATVQAGFTPANGGSNIFIGPITLSLTNTFNTSSGDLHLSNSISGSGGLTKAGARTLWLHAPNTYTGPTTINPNSGKIVLGAQSSLASKVIQVGSDSILEVTAPPAFTLGGGQVLGGEGTVAGGNVVIGPGATLLTGLNDNTVGTLTMNGSLAIQTGGTNRVVVNKTSTLSNNKVGGLASVQIGGTLAVVNIGEPLAAGDVITLFEAAIRTGSGLDSITPATPGPGLAWDTSTLLVDGNLRVKVRVDPANATITARVTDHQVILSWPTGLGWGLQVQTNALGTGLGSNWFDVEGSTTNAEMTFPIDPGAGSTFYRLIYR